MSMGREKVPPPSDGRRVAIYARKSDLDSESRGKSVAQQVEQCLIACKALGLEVSERLIFREEDGNKGWWSWQDEEGRNQGPFRPELTRMMREVEAGNVDAVVCWRSDRLHRDEVVAALLLRRLRSRRVRLYVKTLDMAIHLADGYGRAISEACANRTYSDKISEDIVRCHLANAAVGRLTRDPSCYGFRSAGRGTGAVVAMHDEIAVVRRIFALYTVGEENGPMTARAIAIRLMDEGVRLAVGAKGHKANDPSFIHPGQITHVLRNPQYAGFLRHDKVLYPTELFHVPSAEDPERLEAVVPQRTFDEAQRRLDENDWHARDKAPRLLNGAIVCPSCGRKVYAHSRSDVGKRYIVCPYRCGKYRSCWAENYRTLDIANLEAWVREHLAPLLAAELAAMSLERAGRPVHAELAGVERRLAEVRALETERLAEMVHALDATQFAGVAARFRAEREALERRASELRVRARADADDGRSPLELVSETDGVVRQALLRAVRWMAVTKWGVVVLSRSGAYIGARLGPGKKRGRGGHRPPILLPPSVEATMECRSWLTDPEAFVAGRRKVEGKNGRWVEDESLLPPFRVSDGAV